MAQTIVNHGYEIGDLVGVISDPNPTKPTRFVVVGIQINITGDGPQTKYKISTLVEDYSGKKVSVTEASGCELYIYPVPPADKDTVSAP